MYLFIEQLIGAIKILDELLTLLFFGVYLSIHEILLWIFPPKEKSLAGEVILVTGSANGIGKELCTLIEGSGASLVCWDIDRSRNEQLVAKLRARGVQAHGYTVDLRSPQQVVETAEKVRREVGAVSMLVNNAAVMPCKRFDAQNPEEIKGMFDLNVFGLFWTINEFLPMMLTSGKGHIVTVCSAAGLIPTRNLSTYCASKHAVHGFIESLKEEIRHSKSTGIRFTTIYPFSCNTQLLRNIRSHSRFPVLCDVLSPEYVAKKLLQGIRQNKEYIYEPKFVQFAGVMTNFLHPKLQAACNDFFNCFVEPVTEAGS